MMTPELADVLALIRARTMSSLTADERTLVLALVDWRERALRAEEERDATKRMCRELAVTASATSVRRMLDDTKAEVTSLRSLYTTLVRSNLHPSDDYRMRVFREALARVEGWGM